MTRGSENFALKKFENLGETDESCKMRFINNMVMF